MENKLEHFFSENEFDFHEPQSGHLKRFEKKLKGRKSTNSTPWKLMSMTASIALIIGFSLGVIANKFSDETHQGNDNIAKVETYFINTINTEIIELEKNRNLQTEALIENALEEIEKLEDDYKIFVQELNKNAEYRPVLGEMIKNYQKRLEILQNTLELVEKTKNPILITEEDYI